MQLFSSAIRESRQDILRSFTSRLGNAPLVLIPAIDFSHLGAPNSSRYDPFEEAG